AANVAAVLIGKNIGGLVSQLQGYGADTVYTVDGDAFDKYNVVSYGAGLEGAIKEFQPQLVLGVASPLGRDVFPRLAARFDAGILTDVISLKAEGDQVVGLKPMFAGKCRAEIATQGSKLNFVTIRSNVFPANKSGQGSAA